MAKGLDIDSLIDAVCRHFELDRDVVTSSSRQRPVARPWGIICCLAFDQLLLTHIPRMGLTPMLPDITHDPIATGLFGAIGLVVIPQDLLNLIHEPESRIRSGFF
jgi:hypothetical protein